MGIAATGQRRLLLVGWDAADWKVISPLVDQGLMPHTAGLIENGVMGNLATLNPMFSPMLWTSIATGKRPYKHGIHGFLEPDPDAGGVRPITNLSRKTKAIWNLLNQNGKKSLVVGWWPSNPAEPIHGAMVSNQFQRPVAPLNEPWPMPDGTVYPPELGPELATLRIHPLELEGDMLRSFVARAPEIDQQEDKRLLTLAKYVAECSGVHAAATHLMQSTPDWDFTAVYYDAVDHFGHTFMKYHPPKLKWVSTEDFEIYKDVVKGGYVYHDMMLGALLEIAGADTTVILMSDHGFHSDQLRPESIPNEPAGAAAEHRQFGIFVASGPGIKNDDLVFGASLLDITPTILSLFGLPVGRDMDGRALTDIYEVTPHVEYIDSWDAVQGDDGRHPANTRIDPVDATEAIRQLVDLGYIEEPDEDQSKAVDEINRELRYALALAYVDGGRFVDATKIFAELWDLWPRENRFGVCLLRTQIDLGQAFEARETMTMLRDRKSKTTLVAAKELEVLLDRLREEHPSDDTDATSDGIDWTAVSDLDKRRTHHLRGQAEVNLRAFAFLEGSLLHLEGQYEDSLAQLSRAAGAQASNLPSLYMKMGEVCISKRDWKEAERHYRKVTELDALCAQAHFGLARVAIQVRAWETAANEAMIAAGQHYFHAPAHFYAGLALRKLGRNDEALAALHRAVAISPVYPAAHRLLATLYLSAGSDWDAHVHHLQLARAAKQRIAEQNSVGCLEDQHAVEVRETFEADNCMIPNVLSDPSHSLPRREETVVVVTGLPRSGTSMMMQMLHAGGVPVLVDDHRPPDASNQRGYLEYAKAKTLARERDWVAGATGQAVKIVAQLLAHLPLDQRYRIIIMHRPLPQIVSSQQKMLERLEKDGAAITAEALMQTFQHQFTQARTLLTQLRKQGVLDVLDVKYDDALRDPASVANNVASFLGGEFDVISAAAAVDSTLGHEG